MSPLRLLLVTALASVSAWAQNPAVSIGIDANANRHPISPLIYGVAYGDATTLPALNATANRMGGNNTSRYNWQLNADNRAGDWFFESIGDASSTAGERGDTFFSLSRAAGVQTLLTVPMVGWVAKLGPNRNDLASFSQAKYGAQTASDQWFPDAGNGVLQSNGQNVTGNDPNDANVAADSTFQSAWVQHLVSTWGTANTGGVRYYILDNEHSIWFATHRDVHPVGPTMDEIKTKMIDYAAKIKAIDPSAKIVGPEEWGWGGYFNSGFDQQYSALNNGATPDRAAHGNMDYLPWLLTQLKANPVAGGLPPLDVFSVHFYPQSGELGNDTSTATQLLRNRSTRSLWDPNYTDESWIAAKVQLIPRLKNWVSTYYNPGTPVAITEYNWGAESSINGATTQADIYGIFGRESLDMATRWTTPDPSTPTFKAMQMYRNYDGAKSTFGDTSIRASAPSPDDLSAFAAVRSSDGALTVMVINKDLTGTTPVTLNLANFTPGTAAHVYQLTAANTISHLSDLSLTGATLSTQVPQQSVTLFIIPAGTTSAPPTAAITANPLQGNTPLTVAFSGTNSSAGSGSITSYAWSFGDGATGTGATTSHVYTTAGTFTAKLTVTNSGGATASATTNITATTAATLAAPTGLKAVAGDTKATLSWTAVSGATGYHVKQAASAAGPFTTIATATGTSSTATGLTDGNTYFFAVSAINSTTESANSTAVSARPLATTKQESETAKVEAISAGVTTSILSESGLSAGKGILVAFTSAGQFITYGVNVPQPGTYDVRVGYKRNTNRGIYQLSIDSTNQGGPVDEYGSVSYPSTDLGKVTFTTAGVHFFTFTCTGKRSASSALSLTFDYISLTQQ